MEVANTGTGLRKIVWCLIYPNGAKLLCLLKKFQLWEKAKASRNLQDKYAYSLLMRKNPLHQE